MGIKYIENIIVIMITYATALALLFSGLKRVRNLLHVPYEILIKKSLISTETLLGMHSYKVQPYQYLNVTLCELDAS